MNSGAATWSLLLRRAALAAPALPPVMRATCGFLKCSLSAPQRLIFLCPVGTEAPEEWGGEVELALFRSPFLMEAAFVLRGPGALLLADAAFMMDESCNPLPPEVWLTRLLGMWQRLGCPITRVVFPVFPKARMPRLPLFLGSMCQARLLVCFILWHHSVVLLSAARYCCTTCSVGANPFTRTTPLALLCRTGHCFLHNRPHMAFLQQGAACRLAIIHTCGRCPAVSAS